MTYSDKVKILLGGRIKRIRKEKGLTQEQLAEKAALSSKYLSRVELGKENPTIDVFIKLSQALGVFPTEIFTFEHEEQNPEKLKSLIGKLIETASTEKLQLAAKLVRSVVR